MTQETNSNHYLARCLTRPWEVPERQVHVLDLSDRSIHLRRTRSFFAREKVYSQAEEDFLKFEVETPLASFRDRYHRTGDISLGSMKEFWGLHFLVLTQAVRYSYVFDEEVRKAGPSLDFINHYSEDERRGLQSVLFNRFELVVIQVPRLQPLVLIETGIFPLPMNDWRVPYVTAIPIDTHLVLVQVPNIVADEFEALWHKNSDTIAAFSAGIEGAPGRIILHPAMLGGKTPEPIVDKLLEVRRGNKLLKDQIKAASKMFGVHPLSTEEILR